MTNQRFIITERIQQLLARQKHVYETHQHSTQADKNYKHAFETLYANQPMPLRHAKSFAYAMINEPVIVLPYEKFHGVFFGYPRFTYWLARNEFEKQTAQQLPEYHQIAGPLDTFATEQKAFILSDDAGAGHIAWNYDWILSMGFQGLIDKYRTAFDSEKDPDKREFYECVIICLKAVLQWNSRYVEALQKEYAASEDEAVRKNLNESIEVMKQVPAKAAKGFRQALQSYHFQHICVLYEVAYGGNCPGRFDWFLWPYLRKDYESGKLTYQQAAELLAEFLIKFDQRAHLQDTDVQPITLGGLTPDGKDAVNPLTYILIDVIEQLPITHPSVYTRISKVNDQQYFDRCVENLLNGQNRAQLLNDEAILPAMMRNSKMSFEDASMYVCGGCMEIAPHGMNSDLLFTFLYNTPKTLELLITGGQCLLSNKQRMKMDHWLGDFNTFDDFYAEFEKQVRRILIMEFQFLDIVAETWTKYRPAFLQSSMLNDCFERGAEQHAGGARYPDYGGSILGMQNVADSLYAIKTVIFERKSCTAEELLSALKANFAGYEQLRLELAGVAKYGQDDPAANKMMQQVVQSVSDIFESYTNRHSGRMKPVILTFTWAAPLGADLGASADGRFAGCPIAHGLTPQSSSMTHGITAAINSYCSLDNELISGGASTMWDMNADWIDHSLLKSIVKSFINQGGQIFQGNMTNVKELQAALENPKQYPNLIVRVGGFSARFVNLSEDVQREIVERYRHSH